MSRGRTSPAGAPGAGHRRAVGPRPAAGLVGQQPVPLAPADKWLPQGAHSLGADRGPGELLRRWLRSFGPGTFADIKWWTGWTAADVKTRPGRDRSCGGRPRRHHRPGAAGRPGGGPCGEARRGAAPRAGCNADGMDGARLVPRPPPARPSSTATATSGRPSGGADASWGAGASARTARSRAGSWRRSAPKVRLRSPKPRTTCGSASLRSASRPGFERPWSGSWSPDPVVESRVALGRARLYSVEEIPTWFSHQEAAQEDAQAQAQEDAEEDQVGPQGLSSAWPLSGRSWAESSPEWEVDRPAGVLY